MARTYDKSAMEDISLFSTATEFEELELFSSLSFSRESELLPNYDVYSCMEDSKPPLPNFLAEDLLQELDFEDGSRLLDSDWMTEKLEFNSTEPDLTDEVVATSSTEPVLLVGDSSFMDLDSVELTISPNELSAANNAPEVTIMEALEPQSEGNIFAGVEEILKRLCADRKIPYNDGNTSGPSSPSQNVPEVEVPSPCSVTSQGSDLCGNNADLHPVESDDESVLSLSSPDIQTTPVKSNVQVVKSPPRATLFTPYTKEKPAKVRSPQQKKRKREQNKDAATRYRVKKRDEQNSIQKELSGLEKENVDLKEKVTSLSKEIEYLKNLMLEVCKTKLQKQAMMALRVK